MRPIIAYVGMTHLGLVSAIAAAERGFDVIGFDPDPSKLALLQKGELPIVEPGLAEALARSGSRLTFSADAAILARASVVYVAPDVPTDETGTSDLGPISTLIAIVEKAIASEAILVILSQVPPGFTRFLGKDPARCFYQVETLVFGRAFERAYRPERFMVGAADSAAPLPEALETYLRAFSCPILVMRYESAELAKISINMFLVASVTTSNTLAELCEKVGADWSEIMPALRLDARIGPHAYLKPGLGIAGGNLERDLATVVRIGNSVGTDVGLVRAFQFNSQYRRDWVLRTLHDSVLSRIRDPQLAILGLAYKENTHSTKNSPALALLKAIAPFRVRAFDPVVSPDPAWHPRLTGASSALDAADGADALLVMTPWPEFTDISAEMLRKKLSGRVVIDPYAILAEPGMRALGLDYHRLGVA
jgi:UDPglucose 6-dehydrogenase